jgi:S-adenosylmethionine decarboxylase
LFSIARARGEGKIACGLLIRQGPGYCGGMSDLPDHSPGLHLIVDLYGASHLDDQAALDSALRGAAAAAGATVLADHLHHFGEGHGVTGVLVLAESHISIHTWPETGYAAVDIFLCGRSDAHKAADHLRAVLRPERVVITEIARGQG